jgi:transcriptional antiterminator RfaH
MTDEISGYWAVARTESQREKTAEYHLKRQDFEIYLPVMNQEFRTTESDACRRPRLVNRLRKVPLFPGYIFVRVIYVWYPIRETIGIRQILMNVDRPAIVQDEVIDAIRRRENKDGYIKIPKTGFKVGQKLQMIGGTYQGNIVLYEGMSAHERIWVLWELLGRVVRVEIDPKDVTAVPPIAS